MSYDDGQVVNHENFVNGTQWNLLEDDQNNNNKSSGSNQDKKRKKNCGIFLCENEHVPRCVCCKTSEGRVCDKCESEISKGSIMYRCIACDWDCCEKCGPIDDQNNNRFKEHAHTRVGLLLGIQRRQNEAMGLIRQGREIPDLSRMFVKQKYESALSRLGDSNNTEAIGADDTNQHRCMRCKGTGVLLCCDGCPNSIHLSCAGLYAAPPGKWFCKACKKKRLQEKRWKRLCGD